MNYLLFTLLLFVSGFSQAQCGPHQLLEDPGFEQMGIDSVFWGDDCWNDTVIHPSCHWSYFQDGGHVVYTLITYDGLFSYLCNSGGNGQTVNLDANTTYKLSCWVNNADSTNAANFYLTMGVQTSTTPFPINSGWHKVSMNYSTGAAPETIQIHFYGGSKMYIDEFSLCDVAHLGMEQKDISSAISIQPNPGNSLVEIVGINPNNTFITLFNSTGQILVKNYNQRFIDISNLPVGSYFVEVQSDQMTKNLKLIKQ